MWGKPEVSHGGFQIIQPNAHISKQYYLIFQKKNIF